MGHIIRQWVNAEIEAAIAAYENEQLSQSSGAIYAEIMERIAQNQQIHEQDCINLNPGTNAMNPRAEAVLSQGLGRPSLGYPGDKYEMGLEGIERIEVLAAGLACEVFEADYAEIRVPSGAIANLYAFMATCQLGDTIITPPPTIAGHVTHHRAGAAGLYGLNILHAPIDAARYIVDLDALNALAQEQKPRLITIGGSLNLNPHPVADVRAIADAVGAKVLFDAAHLSGIIAGKAWENPLKLGAHMMTMSTYKSLGGPAAGLLLTNDAEIAERVDEIAYPGLTANFDAGKSAALAISLLDWRDYGRDYASAMVRTAQRLASELAARGLPLFRTQNSNQHYTQSHQFAVEAINYGGGQRLAKRLRQAHILSCGIGLPIAPIAGDVNGLRLGTNEIVRWGMTEEDMPAIADFVARACEADSDLAAIAAEVTAFRKGYNSMRYVHA
ncbi:MAG: aminotransferase class I/II-fold pyridoxal phosphate-dependent enzyme [Anaerolineaceae bacterium]|nr:aminotransferase class I/II-fold pyridoxal phosphate-dependent enzyme [Anaerolineaceae bacterium]